MQKNTTPHFNPIILGIILVSAIFIVLLVVTLINLLRSNPYGPEIKIDNLTGTYKNIPESEQDLIYSELYNIVSNNSEPNAEIPTSGAIIRDDSATSDYDKTNAVHSGSFIVDIPSIEQSYLVQFEWSPSSQSQGLGGYPVVITCLPEDKQIYPTTGFCKDTLDDKYVTWQNEYQIDYSFGLITSSKIRESLSKFFISMVPATNYTAILDETSLSRIKTESDPTFSFRVALNNEKTYQITARVDESYGQIYIALYAEDIDSSSNHYAVIITNDEDAESMLTSWLKDISNQEDLKITRINL